MAGLDGNDWNSWLKIVMDSQLWDSLLFYYGTLVAWSFGSFGLAHLLCDFSLAVWNSWLAWVVEFSLFVPSSCVHALLLTTAQHHVRQSCPVLSVFPSQLLPACTCLCLVTCSTFHHQFCQYESLGFLFGLCWFL